MSGVPKIEIFESVETLKSLLKQQKTALNFAKVLAVYLIKIQAVETVRYLAVIIGRSETTIHYWLQLYRQGGLEKLLEEHPQTGRPKKLDVETVAKIPEELSDREGFTGVFRFTKYNNSSVLPQFLMSVFVTRSSASTNPFSNSSLVRAARLRRYALIFDQQFSIGTAPLKNKEGLIIQC